MIAITVNISEFENKKLMDLAAARKMTPEQCIRDFLVNCNPGGGGWKHPMDTKVAEAKPADAEHCPPQVSAESATAINEVQKAAGKALAKKDA